MSQPLLSEQDIPLVSIDFMNTTHQEEAEIVNALAVEISGRLDGADNEEKISQSLESWLQHTQAHFQRENELMQQTGFPAYPVHAQEHASAHGRLQSEIEAWQQDKNIGRLKEYVFTLWPAWFKAHVNSMDRVTAQFALDHGYSEH